MILNASSILSFDPKAATSAGPGALILKGGVLTMRGGAIEFVGTAGEFTQVYGESPEKAVSKGEYTAIDARGKCAAPGLVDSHTHLVFAGTRENELEMKLDGKTYMQILEAGGGILSTVRATREAGPEQLREGCLGRLDTMLEHGTTTVEAKSGYGLTVEDELKCLRVLGSLEDHPVDVIPTRKGTSSWWLERCWTRSRARGWPGTATYSAKKVCST
jgi:imidazolonepropionase